MNQNLLFIIIIIIIIIIIYFFSLFFYFSKRLGLLGDGKRNILWTTRRTENLFYLRLTCLCRDRFHVGVYASPSVAKERGLQYFFCSSLRFIKTSLIGVQEAQP